MFTRKMIKGSCVLYLLAHLISYIAALTLIVRFAQQANRNPLIWALVGGVGAFLIMFGGSVLAFQVNPDDPSSWPLPTAYAWLAATILFVKYGPEKDII